jgi:hypothetical protein
MGATFKQKGRKNFTLLNGVSDIADKQRKRVKVGFLSSANERYENGVSVPSVALWNEFGTQDNSGGERIPPRPFMRTTMTSRKVDIDKLRNKLILAVLRGTITLDTALNMLGRKVSGWMKYTIDHGKFTPNAASTIAKKGVGKRPLVDTGQLRQSINHEVYNG